MIGIIVALGIVALAGFLLIRAEVKPIKKPPVAPPPTIEEEAIAILEAAKIPAITPPAEVIEPAVITPLVVITEIPKIPVTPSPDPASAYAETKATLEAEAFVAFEQAQEPEVQIAIAKAVTPASIMKSLIEPRMAAISPERKQEIQPLITTGLRALSDWSKGNLRELLMDIQMGYPYRDIVAYQGVYPAIPNWATFEKVVRGNPESSPSKLIDSFNELGGTFQEYVQYVIAYEYLGRAFSESEIKQIFAAYGISLSKLASSPTINLQLALATALSKRRVALAQMETQLEEARLTGYSLTGLPIDIIQKVIREQQQRITELEAKLAAAQRGEPKATWWF